MTMHLALASSLNVRMSPNKDSANLTDLPRYTLVEEIGANASRTWLQVKAGNLEGWVYNDFLIPKALWDLPWVARAIGEFGVGEHDDDPETTDNPRIVEYHKTLGGPLKKQRDLVHWCSSFVHWCFGPGVAIPGITRRARSWRAWGTEIETPKPGAIVVLWRRPSAKESPKQNGLSKKDLIADGKAGHVGFFVELADKQAILFGGNQSSRANKLGEVCKRAYPLDGDEYGLLSCRWPPGVP